MAQLIDFNLQQYIGLNVLANPKLLVSGSDIAEKAVVDAAIASNSPEIVSAALVGKRVVSGSKAYSDINDYPSSKIQKESSRPFTEISEYPAHKHETPEGFTTAVETKPPYQDISQYESSNALAPKIPRDTSQFMLQNHFHNMVIPNNRITIIDIDCACEPGNYLRGIEVQGVPLELDYQPESNFASIKGIGRNTPHYHYTGGEDTLEMVLDWYCTQDDHKDVLFKCRWLEALTKNDGYSFAPHRVMINWGNKELLSDGSNTIFEGMVWLLTAAPYKLSGFNNGYLAGENGDFLNRRGKFVSTALRPRYATQHLTFKRLVEYNLTRSQIMFPSEGTWTGKFQMIKNANALR